MTRHLYFQSSKLAVFLFCHAQISYSVLESILFEYNVFFISKLRRSFKKGPAKRIYMYLATFYVPTPPYHFYPFPYPHHLHPHFKHMQYTIYIKSMLARMLIHASQDS